MEVLRPAMVRTPAAALWAAASGGGGATSAIGMVRVFDGSCALFVFGCFSWSWGAGAVHQNEVVKLTGGHVSSVTSGGSGGSDPPGDAQHVPSFIYVITTSSTI